MRNSMFGLAVLGLAVGCGADKPAPGGATAPAADAAAPAKADGGAAKAAATAVVKIEGMT